MSRKPDPDYSSLLYLALLLAAIFVAFWLLVDVREVWAQLRTANPGGLLAASAMLCAGLLAYAARWRLLLANEPDLLPTFNAANIGHAGNILIPARAGEALRIIVISRTGGVSLTAATSSFVVERLFEQMLRLAALGGAVLSGAGLSITPAGVISGVAVVILALTAVSALIRRRERVLARGPRWLARLPRVTEDRARASLADLLSSLQSVSQPRRLLQVIAWSLLSWGCFWGFFYLTLRALPGGFSPAQWLPLSLGALALSPPSAPTQPGIFHASIVVPLTAVSFPAAPLTAYAILLHILEMAWMIGLAFVGIVLSGLSPRSLLSATRQPPPG